MAGFDNEVMFAPGERLEVSSTLNIQSMQQVATDVSRVNFSGNPNGIVPANPSSISHDPTTGNIWRKASGVGTTLWELLNGVLTLQGNTGGKVSPDGTGNINIITANASVGFAGSGNTLTIDFQDLTFTNLVLGSKPSGGQGLAGFGTNALASVTTGRYNTGLGSFSLNAATTANFATMVGNSSGLLLVSGQFNTGVGFSSLASITNTDGSTGLGYFSLNSSTGSQNTAIGLNSLNLLGSGSQNTAIGYNSGVAYTSSESSNILVGNAGVVAESHVLRIGTAGGGVGQQSSCFVAGITGVTVSASSPVGVNASGQLSDLGFGTVGQVLTSNGPATSPTWQAGASVLSVKSITHGASPYTVLAADEFLACQTSGGVITILLPNAPTSGRVIYIKDSNGAASVSNISVTTVGGAVTIDGVTTYTLNANYQSISVVFDGSNYEVF